MRVLLHIYISTRCSTSDQVSKERHGELVISLAMCLLEELPIIMTGSWEADVRPSMLLVTSLYVYEASLYIYTGVCGGIYV